jgi:transposase
MSAADTPPPVRYRPIDRTQRSNVSLDEQLPDDHPVRLLWDFTEHLDLSAFDRPHKAVQGHPGAPVVPARLLFALWLFATIEGVCSSRRLAELCTRDLPYQWLCGGTPVGYHTLADFYSCHESALRELFVEHVAALRQHDLIDLTEVTVDGRKVPASASKESFHRQGTLERHLQQAEQHLRSLQEQRDQAATASARQQAARLRAARERHGRLKEAVRQVQQRQKQRQETDREHVKPDEARASETDPDAVKMKRADGGYRACFNVQTVMSASSELIVTVGVCQQRSDNGLFVVGGGFAGRIGTRDAAQEGTGGQRLYEP